jgi:hypothetical protein
MDVNHGPGPIAVARGAGFESATVRRRWRAGPLVIAERYDLVRSKAAQPGPERPQARPRVERSDL